MTSAKKKEPYIYMGGENVAAICVREVKAVKSPDGESTLEFGESFWRVYWGLADKEAKSPAPPRYLEAEASRSGPH